MFYSGIDTTLIYIFFLIYYHNGSINGYCSYMPFSFLSIDKNYTNFDILPNDLVCELLAHNTNSSAKLIVRGKIVGIYIYSLIFF